MSEDEQVERDAVPCPLCGAPVSRWVTQSGYDRPVRECTNCKARGSEIHFKLKPEPIEQTTMTPYEECKRIQEECDARGEPYPWAKPYKLIVAGDARVDMKSDRPLVRSKCPKCGYTLTTNEQPSDWKCPVDGETLGAVPYP